MATKSDNSKKPARGTSKSNPGQGVVDDTKPTPTSAAAKPRPDTNVGVKGTADTPAAADQSSAQSGMQATVAAKPALPELFHERAHAEDREVARRAKHHDGRAGQGGSTRLVRPLAGIDRGRQSAGVQQDHRSPKPTSPSSTRSASVGSPLWNSGSRGRGGIAASPVTIAIPSRITAASLTPRAPGRLHLGDPVAVAAVADRLVHHAEVTVLKGDRHCLRGKLEEVLSDPRQR